MKFCNDARYFVSTFLLLGIYKEPVLENEPKSFAHDPGRKKREDMTNIQSMISLSQTEWKVLIALKLLEYQF